MVPFIMTIMFLNVHGPGTGSETVSVEQSLEQTQTIVIPENGFPVYHTVAEALVETLTPEARIYEDSQISSEMERGTLRLEINPSQPPEIPENESSGDWTYFRLDEAGNGVLSVSDTHLLYALFAQIHEEWSERSSSEFEEGRFTETGFGWMIADDGFYGTRRRFTRDYDPESAVREMARLGCSHVAVNALAQPIPLEFGVPGESYYRYYVSAPDLDQFVDTKLNRGVYPPEYLGANLQFLKEQAALAVQYGLTPGMHICNPRSVPESLLEEYPHLRGARVDHPFRSLRPRYTLTLGHPVVRWHYAQLLRKILTEIPELGFMSTWLNDSGSGFEYTSRLYPGRNGGPYIVREWQPDSVIAEAAGENVIRYYRLMRDVAREINPDFRIIAGLRAIPEEESVILDGMDDGIDTYTSIEEKQDSDRWEKLQKITGRGSMLHTYSSVKGSFIPGVPSPWHAYRQLTEQHNAGFAQTEVKFSPPSLAKCDINREILRAFQLGVEFAPDSLIERKAVDWVGEEYATSLTDIWEQSNQVVEETPVVPLYGQFAFEWMRLWVRPLVPDIDRIPEPERRYYEQYLVTLFNNPHRVDFQAECLWDLISVEQADRLVATIDNRVMNPLDTAIGQTEGVLEEIPAESQARELFQDLRDRLVAHRCYLRTLRNTSAWIAGVHGYLNAEDDDDREKRLAMVREMVESELQNTRELLRLWENSETTFMPIYDPGETWFQYGENFGELLKEKIRLTEEYGEHTPYIDPEYMWRSDDHFPLEREEYIDY